MNSVKMQEEQEESWIFNNYDTKNIKKSLQILNDMWYNRNSIIVQTGLRIYFTDRIKAVNISVNGHIC